LSPEVKQAIADEVKAQLAAEREDSAHPAAAVTASNTGQSNGGGAVAPTSEDQLPAALDPKHTTFVVSATLNEPTDDGTECALSGGDVVTRIQNTPDADNNVRVLVSSSQKGDCSSGSQVTVAVQDLQDMYNDFHAKMDDGLGKMADNQGKNGMPKGPASAKKSNPDGQVQPDLTVEADLKAQQDDATKTEKEVQDASSSGGSGGGNN
jgi:hypothetical protein